MDKLAKVMLFLLIIPAFGGVLILLWGFFLLLLQAVFRI
jgi:hypothetical protein